MLLEFIILIIGCILIVFLAHIVLKRTIELADHYGWSGTFIGLTVLSIGTSLPEILTAFTGSMHILREPGLYHTVSSLVLGTNIGSDIFQQNFILGVVAILATVVVVKKRILPVIGGLIGASLILFIFGLSGRISRLEGFILFVAYIGYLMYLQKKEKHSEEKTPAKHNMDRKHIVTNFFLLVLSFGIMAIAANYVLRASEVLVKLLPISASFFGIIILGVASALPELTTALVALKKNMKEMSVGVLLGSNITNPTFALGLGAVFSSYAVPKVIIVYDLPFKIVTCFLILYLLLKNKSLGKKEGVLLIALFLAYLIFRNLFFPTDF